MASTTQRYPLSTPDGSAIPLDIMKPHSFIMKSFIGGAATDPIAVPEGVEIVSLSVTEDCIVCFGDDAVQPVDGVSYLNTVYVEKSVRICLAPSVDTFTIISATATSGTALIQFIEKWAGLAVQTQYSKR